MSAEFTFLTPKDLWQDFGTQQNSSIETTIFNIERLVSKYKDNFQVFNQAPFKFEKTFIFQEVAYQIQHIPVEDLIKDQNGNEILPFAESNSPYQVIHFLYDINEPFFEISQINNNDAENAENLSRFLAQASVFRNFPVFVRIPNDICHFHYIGSKFAPNYQMKFNFVVSYNNEISTIIQLRNKFKQFKKLTSKIDTFRPLLTRLIYHVRFESISIIICGELPHGNISMSEMDLNHSSRILLSFEEEIDSISEFSNAFSFCDSHDDSFNFITLPKHITENGLDENSFEWEGFSGSIEKMNIDVNFVPSNTILTKLANHLIVEFDKYPNFDTCWKYFLAYIKSCISRQQDIQLVDFESIDHSHCLMYQKLVLINICLHKLKLRLKTSNFVLTSDMISLIDNNIIKEYSKIAVDNELDIDTIRMIRNKALEAKSAGRTNLDSFLKNKTGTNKILAKIAWEVIPPSYFEMNFLIEYALDFFEGLNIFDILKSLVFILLCEKYNEAGSISRKITQLINSLRSQMDLLSMKEFVQRAQRIDSLISKLLASNYIRNFMTISKSFANCSLLIDQLLRDKIVVAETSVERDAIKQFLNNMSRHPDVEVSKDKEYVVSDDFQDQNVKASIRTVFIDKGNKLSFSASAIKEELVSD